MFTQKCFIRKNTSSLFKRLEQIGGRSGVAFQHEKYNTLSASPDLFRCVRDDSTELLINDGYIDCGTNEELFLAIASLRDDSDIHQWFIHDDSDWHNDQNIFWHKCESESIKIDMAFNIMYSDCRKATVEELIEHFKS